MRRLLKVRWLLILVVAAAVLAAGPSSVDAAPAQQVTVSVVVFAYVDVASPGDPFAPCNLQFDDEDEAYAQTNPLPSMWFKLEDGSGGLLERQETSALATLQRVRFEDIAEQPTYNLILEAPPSGWALCPQESATRTLHDTDFVLGSARETYHFFRPDRVTPEPGVTPTETPSGATATPPPPTVTPGGPTVTAAPPTEEPPPTPKPPATSKPPDEGEEEEGGGYQPSLPYIPGRGEYGRIQGVAFIDTNYNGVFDAGEPGLNDVQVYLHGGGLELSHVTDATGTYNFDILGDGQYDVFIQPGSEWFITTPQKYVVTVAGVTVSGIDFGLIRYTDLPEGFDTSQPPAQEVVEAESSTGIKLPSTGVTKAPGTLVFGGLALLLSALGLVGLTTERWWKRNR
jgi:hypothetical protein